MAKKTDWVFGIKKYIVATETWGWETVTHFTPQLLFLSLSLSHNASCSCSSFFPSLFYPKLKSTTLKMGYVIYATDSLLQPFIYDMICLCSLELCIYFLFFLFIWFCRFGSFCECKDFTFVWYLFFSSVPKGPKFVMEKGHLELLCCQRCFCWR